MQTGSAGVGLACVAGARHDMGAAREHGLIEGLNSGGIHVVADTAYQGGGQAIRVPQRRRRLDPDTGRYRRLSRAQKEVNAAHARQRGPGERANAQLKSWKILRRDPQLPQPSDRPGQSRDGADPDRLRSSWKGLTIPRRHCLVGNVVGEVIEHAGVSSSAQCRSSRSTSVPRDQHASCRARWSMSRRIGLAG